MSLGHLSSFTTLLLWWISLSPLEYRHFVCRFFLNGQNDGRVGDYCHHTMYCSLLARLNLKVNPRGSALATTLSEPEHGFQAPGLGWSAGNARARQCACCALDAPLSALQLKKRSKRKWWNASDTQPTFKTRPLDSRLRSDRPRLLSPFAFQAPIQGIDPEIKKPSSNLNLWHQNRIGIPSDSSAFPFFGGYRWLRPRPTGHLPSS